MAAETEKDAGSPTPATAKANGANGANGARPRRRSSLMVLAQSSTTLPSVESSLEEFISRANQTGTNPEEWRAAEHQAKAQDEARREADSLRWKAAEHQLREGEAREHALRRQLDGLQGRLAEAEARVAVAQSGTQHDGLIADLKFRLQRADERIVASEARERDLARDAAAAREAAEAAKREAMTARSTASVPALAMPMASSFGSEDAEQRIAIAEAKAAKALAAARAAVAGLTVNPADLAAIESGLVVASPIAPKGTNWLAVAGAFLGGLVIAFAVFKVVAKPEAAAAAPAPAAAQAQPPAPTVKPIVTPIEEPAPAPVAQTPVVPAPAAVAPAPVAVAPAPAPVAPAPAPPTHHVTAATHHAAPAHHAAPKKPDQPKATGAIVDPF